MDHLFLMAAAIFGGIGWWLATRRETVFWWVKILAWPAMVWLGVYVIVELLRSQPALWTGTAELSRATLVLVAIGIFLLWQAASIDTRRQDGGESHA